MPNGRSRTMVVGAAGVALLVVLALRSQGTDPGPAAATTPSPAVAGSSASAGATPGASPGAGSSPSGSAAGDAGSPSAQSTGAAPSGPADPSSGSTPPRVDLRLPAEVTLTQANLYSRMSDRSFAHDLEEVLAGRPDFVTLNETGFRSHEQLTPPGYDSYRDPTIPDARETPVLWRSDRWVLVDHGTVLMHRQPDLKWGTRYANWVTLALAADPDGPQVSVVSVHASPGGGGRQGLLRVYFARLDALAADLGSRGAVLIGGDLNVRNPAAQLWSDWLSASGAQSTYDLLGEPRGGWGTGPHGGSIDYILTVGATPLAHRTRDLTHSDHRMLSASIALVPQTATGE